MLKMNDPETSAWHWNNKVVVIMMGRANLFLRSEAVPSFERMIWRKRFVVYSRAFGCNRIQKLGTFLIGDNECCIEKADGLERGRMSRRRIMRRLGTLGFNPEIVRKESVMTHSSSQGPNGVVEAKVLLGVMINKATSGPLKRLAIFSKAFSSRRITELASTWPIRDLPYDYFFWQNSDFAGADMESRKEIKGAVDRFGFNPDVVDTVFPEKV